MDKKRSNGRPPRSMLPKSSPRTEKQRKRVSDMVNRVRIYWDESDSNNLGWAYEVSGPDGLIDSGQHDMDEEASWTQLEEAVINVGYLAGVEIECGNVHVDEHVDGGYAEWNADDEDNE